MRMRGLVLAGVALILAPACGGGGRGSAPQGEDVFRVTQVTPFDASEDVGLHDEINVVFSDEVDPASLTDQTLQVVAESGDEIAGQRLVAPLNRSLVRFLPLVEYFPFAEHTIRVTTGVRDMQGRTLDKEYEFRFQTVEEDPVLPTPSQVEDLGPLLRTGRWFHRMTLLANRRFLITGGYIAQGVVTGTAENLIVDFRESFGVKSPMRRPRAAHVQVTLADGRILIAGGEISDNPFVPIADCEIFDPAGFAFGPAAPMHVARSFAHGTLLADGRVLVTGGQGVLASGFAFLDDAEIYDPASDSWTHLASRMETGRSGHFAGRLAGGDVVVIGGTPGLPSAARWTAATESFATSFSTPSFPHFLGAGTILPDGRTFLATGLDSTGVTIYDPRFGFVGALNRLGDERAFATATAFEDGRVLIVGGTDFNSVPALIHDTIDLFFPIGATGKVFRLAGVKLPVPTSHHAAARGPDGSIWIVGGLPLDLSLPGLKQVTVIRPGE